jgi:hypothetical protein
MNAVWMEFVISFSTVSNVASYSQSSLPRQVTGWGINGANQLLQAAAQARPARDRERAVANAVLCLEWVDRTGLSRHWRPLGPEPTGQCPTGPAPAVPASSAKESEHQPPRPRLRKRLRRRVGRHKRAPCGGVSPSKRGSRRSTSMLRIDIVISFGLRGIGAAGGMTSLVPLLIDGIILSRS